MTSDQNNKTTEGHRERELWTGLYGNADAYEIVQLASTNPKKITLIVTKDSISEERIFNALCYLAPKNLKKSVMRFPAWETLPYDSFSPHQDIISERLSSLHKLVSKSSGTLVISAHTLMQRIAPVEYLAGSTFSFEIGDRMILEDQKINLESASYRQADIVSEKGQYASRGSILDLYPMGNEFPLRLDLFDDEIESIRSFDPSSQLTIENLENFKLLPAKEFPFDEEAIKKFRENWHNNFQGDVRRCTIYQDVSNYMSPNGIEFFLPFFFDKTASIFSYLQKDSQIRLSKK